MSPWQPAAKQENIKASTAGECLNLNSSSAKPTNKLTVKLLKLLKMVELGSDPALVWELKHLSLVYILFLSIQLGGPQLFQVEDLASTLAEG